MIKNCYLQIKAYLCQHQNKMMLSIHFEVICFSSLTLTVSTKDYREDLLNGWIETSI